MSVKREKADDAYATSLGMKAIAAWQAFIPIQQALRVRKLDIEVYLHAKRTRRGFRALMQGVYKSKALDCAMREVVVMVAERIIQDTWITWKEKCVRR